MMQRGSSAKRDHQMRDTKPIHADEAGLIDILDRVLDHGIVLEPSSRVALYGTDLRKLHARVVVEWAKTYF
jgi:hypothetical protein